jgi:ribonuclease-3
LKYEEKINELEPLLKYTFTSKPLLDEALTHPSLQGLHPECKHNQRLEFLGDSILGAVISSWLYEEFQDNNEGKLSEKKALLARGKLLCEIGKDLQLDLFLKAAKSERNKQGNLRESALEDAVEAIIGAVFLDGGFIAAEQVILQWENKFLQAIALDQEMFNPKGKLQEFVQSKFKGTKISYKLAKQSGPDHRREFVIELYLGNEKVSSGSGMSKKAAEENAAVEAIGKLSLDKNI